ncbi:MAG: hypothetical protein K1X67_13900 [Fimbriimonadaceae bacterium]|nr:hypothetical protein [Fimbriimonadaceae bacterium]
MIDRRLLSCAFGLSVAAMAVAGPQNYAQRSTQINAGILLIESQRSAAYPNGTPLNGAPHVWGNLDQNFSARPASWTFVNPRASTSLNESLQLRWSTLTGSAPALNTRLSKRSAPYWEVSLANSSDNVLADFDILLLPISAGLQLNSIERERLRKFIDQGGVLWVDIQTMANFIDVANPTPMPFALWQSNADISANMGHPIFNSPTTVTFEDLFLMQAGGSRLVRPVNLANEGLSGISALLGWVPGESYRMQQLAGNGQGDFISVGQIGQGFLAVTTRGVSQILNRGITGGAISPNLGFYSTGPVSDAATVAASKLAINIVSLGSSFPGVNRGSRRTNASNVDLAAPLFQRWKGETATRLQPSIFKGRSICISNNALVVLDSDPSRDWDGDGNPDDGIADPPGSTYDILWQSAPMAGPVATPVCVEVPDATLNSTRPGFKCVDQILVADGAGNVQIFDLDSVGSAVPSLRTIAPPDAATPGSSGNPFAPTVHEGMAFMADLRSTGNSGRVWIIDLKNSARKTTADDWSIQGAPRLPEPAGSPVVGYIPIADNSGGVDRVVYVPTAPGTGITARPSGITSIWLGAKGEKPLGFDTNTPGVLRITTRASLQGLPIDVSSIKLTILDGEVPLSGTQMAAIFTNSVTQTTNGELQIGMPGALPINAGVRVDYTIDWGEVGPTVPAEIYIRGDLGLPDRTDGGKQVLGMGLSPSGNLFVVGGDGSNGGALFCLKEEGRGDFKLLYRWDLYDRMSFRINVGGGTQETIDQAPAIIDEDYLVQNFLNFLNQEVRNLTFRSGPTILGDTVYVLAHGTKTVFGFPSPVTTVLAFNANPSPVEIDVENLTAGFQIVQPDVARSTTPTTPDAFSSLPNSVYTFEPNVGGSTRGRIRFSTMMSAGRGRVRDSLTTSLPIIIRRGGQGDILVEPELSFEDGVRVPGFARGRFSPLKWYTCLNGFDGRGQPFAAGENLYMAGSSILPSLFSAQFPPIPRGIVYGMDSKIATNDPYMKPIASRPWVPQLNNVKPSSGPLGFSINPDFRWPQVNGVRSFDDLRVRYLQAAVDDPNSRCEGVVGGEGVLLTWTANRIYAFTRSDIYVADEGRVSRFDSAGNPIWATDSTAKAGLNLPTGTVGSDVPLSRPTKVYPGGDNTYWVVDTGNDRVVRADNAGRELRTIKDFKLDPKYRPGGLTDNEPLTLRLPRDILVFQTIETTKQQALTNPRPRELWVHYVIADAGNFRLLEMIDRYEIDPSNGRIVGVVQYVDPQGVQQRALGMLLWHSPSELTGKQYAYNSIGRTFIDDGVGNLRPILAFGFSNVEPGKTSFGLDSPQPQNDRSSGLGGIVVLDPARGATEVITKIRVPAIPANAFYVDSAGTFSSPARPQREQNIGGLSSVTLSVLPNGATGEVAVMFTDNTGVYEIVKSGQDWVVRWMLPNEAFRVMRRMPNNVPMADSNPQSFRASSARRLASGEVIITSSYVGRKLNGDPYFGEVVLVDGTLDTGNTNGLGYSLNKPNLGFNSLSVKFELPPTQGIRDIRVPVFADRR